MELKTRTKIYDVTNNDFGSSIDEQLFYKRLFFNEFLPRLPDQFKIFNRTIPFHAVRIILGSFRYNKPQIRVITKRWNSLGLIEFSKFRGVKLKGD
jgi:hypothetical protein